MDITIVSAIDDGGIIGNGNALPWKIPAELKHFRSYTFGKTLILGRRTFESIGGVLPGRRFVVVASSSGNPDHGVSYVCDLDAALKQAFGEKEVIVAGGATIYEQMLPVASKMVLSRVPGFHKGDVLFPDVDWDSWGKVDSVDHGSFEVRTYERI